MEQLTGRCYAAILTILILCQFALRFSIGWFDPGASFASDLKDLSQDERRHRARDFRNGGWAQHCPTLLNSILSVTSDIM